MVGSGVGEIEVGELRRHIGSVVIHKSVVHPVSEFQLVSHDIVLMIDDVVVRIQVTVYDGILAVEN